MGHRAEGKGQRTEGRGRIVVNEQVTGKITMNHGSGSCKLSKKDFHV